MSDLIPFLAPWSGRALTMLVLVAGVAAALWLLRRPRLASPHCRRCGYDLARTPPSMPCPECGRAWERARSLRGWRRPWLALLALGLGLLLPGYVAARRMMTHGADYYLRLYPLYAFFPERVTATEYRGGYRCEIRVNRRWWAREEARLVIRRGGREVYTASAHMVSPLLQTLAVPDDLNGDGLVDVPFIEYSGGAHCCYTLVIVALDGDRAEERLRIDTINAHPAIIDTDGDGVYEVVFFDNVWSYWNASYVASARPTVKLAWTGRTWEASALHMASPPRPTGFIEERAEQLRRALSRPGAGWRDDAELWRVTLDLIYQGNADQAWELVRRAFPEGMEREREEFVGELLKNLRKSPYAGVTWELNEGKMPAADPAESDAEPASGASTRHPNSGG